MLHFTVYLIICIEIIFCSFLSHFCFFSNHPFCLFFSKIDRSLFLPNPIRFIHFTVHQCLVFYPMESHCASIYEKVISKRSNQLILGSKIIEIEGSGLFLPFYCGVIWDSCDSIMSDDNFTFHSSLKLVIGHRIKMSFWVTTRTHYCGFFMAPTRFNKLY